MKAFWFQCIHSKKLDVSSFLLKRMTNTLLKIIWSFSNWTLINCVTYSGESFPNMLVHLTCPRPCHHHHNMFILCWSLINPWWHWLHYESIQWSMCVLPMVSLWRTWAISCNKKNCATMVANPNFLNHGCNLKTSLMKDFQRPWIIYQATNM